MCRPVCISRLTDPAMDATTAPISAAGWFSIIGTCFTVLLSIITLIVFLARIGPAIDRLTEFMREAVVQLKDHERRVSRLEGARGARES